MRAKSPALIRLEIFRARDLARFRMLLKTDSSWPFTTQVQYDLSAIVWTVILTFSALSLD